MIIRVSRANEWHAYPLAVRDLGHRSLQKDLRGDKRGKCMAAITRAHTVTMFTLGRGAKKNKTVAKTKTRKWQQRNDSQNMATPALHVTLATLHPASLDGLLGPARLDKIGRNPNPGCPDKRPGQRERGRSGGKIGGGNKGRGEGGGDPDHGKGCVQPTCPQASRCKASLGRARLGRSPV